MQEQTKVPSPTHIHSLLPILTHITLSLAILPSLLPSIREQDTLRDARVQLRDLLIDRPQASRGDPRKSIDVARDGEGRVLEYEAEEVACDWVTGRDAESLW